MNRQKTRANARRFGDLTQVALAAVENPQSKRGLTKDIATRQNSIDFMSTVIGGLPNPDPVLKQMNRSIQVYEALLYDSRVSACVQSRKSAVKSMEWDVVGEDSSEAEIEFHKEYLKCYKMEDVVCEALEGWQFGYKPAEIIWDTSTGQAIPRELIGKPSRWFTYGDENELRFLSKGDMFNGVSVPDDRFVVFRNEASYDNPFGRAELSACFWPVTFRRNGLKFYTIYLEKYGMPFLTASAPAGAQKERIQEIADLLSNMVLDAVAVAPKDYELGTLEAKQNSKSGSPVHKEYIDVMNTEICMSILGTNLTTEVTGGSFAASQSHMEVRDDIVEGDKKMIEGGMSEVISIAHRFNFGENSVPPRFVMHAEEKVETMRAERDEKIQNGDPRFKFTEQYYKDKYNLTDNDFELTEPTMTEPVIPGGTE